MKPNRNQGTGSIPYGPKGKKPHGKLRGAQKPHKPHKPAAPKTNQRLDNPARFTQPRTLRSVLGDANTAANLRYGGQERALALQERQNPAWFEQYRAQTQGISQGIQQGYRQGAADVMARQQQTAASDTTARNSLGAQMQKDAASRGATVDPSLLANDVNAANVRNTNSSAFANLLGAQGQAQGAYFGGLQAAGSAAELGQKSRIAQDQKGVATDKGAYRSQYVSDAKDTERKYGLDLRHQAVEDAAFQVDTLTAQGKLKNDRAKIKQAAKDKRAARHDKNQDQGLATRKFHSAQEKDAYQRKHHLGPYKVAAPKATGKSGLTPAQKRAAREKTVKAQSRIETATQLYDTYRKTPGKRDGKPAMPRPQDSYAYLIGKGYSKVEVDLARDRLRNGGRLSARGMQVARSHGIKVPKEWRPKRKPREHFHGTHGG